MFRCSQALHYLSGVAVAAASSSHDADRCGRAGRPIGSIVGLLPDGCATVSAPGAAIYNCYSAITDLTIRNEMRHVYQGVTHP